LTELANPRSSISSPGHEVSSDVEARLWAKLETEADGDTADFVMSAFAATPKARRSPKLRKGPSAGPGRLRSATRNIMMKNRVRHAFGSQLAQARVAGVAEHRREALRAALDQV